MYVYQMKTKSMYAMICLLQLILYPYTSLNSLTVIVLAPFLTHSTVFGLVYMCKHLCIRICLAEPLLVNMEHAL